MSAPAHHLKSSRWSLVTWIMWDFFPQKQSFTWGEGAASPSKRSGKLWGMWGNGQNISHPQGTPAYTMISSDPWGSWTLYFGTHRHCETNYVYDCLGVFNGGDTTISLKGWVIRMLWICIVLVLLQMCQYMVSYFIWYSKSSDVQKLVLFLHQNYCKPQHISPRYPSGISRPNKSLHVNTFQYLQTTAMARSLPPFHAFIHQIHFKLIWKSGLGAGEKHH